MKKIIAYLLVLPVLFQQFDIALYFEKIIPVPSFSVICVSSLFYFYSFFANLELNLNQSRKIFILFLFVTALSLADSIVYNNISSIGKSLAHFLSYIIYASVIISYVKTRDDLDNIIIAFLKLSWIPIMFGFLQFFVYNILKLDVVLLTRSQSYNSEYIRISSLFNEPSWYGLYLVIGLMFSVFYQGRVKTFHNLMLMISLLLTLSLSAFVILIVMAFYFFSKSFSLLKSFSYILGFLICVILFVRLNSSVYDRVSVLMEGRDVGGGVERFSSSYGQFMLWYSNNKFTGVGFGNSANYIDLYYDNIFAIDANPNARANGDSMVLLLLAELGIVGLIYFIVLFYWQFRINRKYSILAYFNSGIFFMIILIFLTQGFFLEPKLWMLIGVFFSLYKIKRIFVNEIPSDYKINYE